MTGSKIILAAGGTGGHVFPAIATAEELKKRGYEVVFATDTRGEKYLKGRRFEYKIISSASPTGNPAKRSIALLKLLWGMTQSNIMLARVRPKLVIGFGGYPSFPPLLAAKMNFIKTILHEQNSVLGKANRFLAKYASVTAISFPETKNAKNGNLVGNPVRAEIVETPFPPLDSKINILITGGSQGAKLFAENMPEALAPFANKISVTHQVRDEQIGAVNSAYGAAKIDFTVKSFFDDMPAQLAKAHLVICRSGASTIFELAAVGRPALFIPLATSAENHQYFNAKAVCDINGGWLLDEKSFNATALSAMLGKLLENPRELQQAAENIKKFAVNDAAKKLADLAESIAK